MRRPYRETKTARLLEIARSPGASSSKLEKIVAELHERQNPFALDALVKVGHLLETVRKKERSVKHILSKIERERRHQELEGYFEWPSTNAPASKHGYVGDVFSYKEGLLRYVGYRVGQTGVSSRIRERILDCVFHKKLPNVDSPEYMNEWSAPATPGRLQKIAETIAALTRNAKRRRNANMTQAIADWESDLKYMYDTYYVDRFQFSWPKTQ